MQELTVWFYHQFRSDRKGIGFTRKELANRAGLTRQMIIRIERSENVVIDELLRCANAANCTLALSDSPWPTWKTARKKSLGGDNPAEDAT